MATVIPIPLILPEVSLESPLATLLNCLDHALIFDDAVIEKCDKATIHAILVHRKVALQALDNELDLQKPPIDIDVYNCGFRMNPRQSALDAIPFRELIIQSIPVNKICAKSKRILWHQRLGHPCDEHLYSAHKFINGMPWFKRRSDVMSKCSTCIKAKIRKTDPGPNSTKRAIYHGQGLSVDFSFSSVKSKNTSQR